MNRPHIAALLRNIADDFESAWLVWPSDERDAVNAKAIAHTIGRETVVRLRQRADEIEAKR